MVAGDVSFPDSFQELVRACSSFCRNNLEKISTEHVRQTRSKLSGLARVFHEQCGTLTPSVKERLEDLKGGHCIVLMTANQPNFFPYSGVLRKTTLNFLLREKLQELLEIPVVNFFGIADQDFTDDKWVRTCQLPAVRRSGGTLSIEAKLPERMMLNSVVKPSHDLVDGWKAQVRAEYLDSPQAISIRTTRIMGLLSGFRRVVGSQCHEYRVWVSQSISDVAVERDNEFLGETVIFL
jgi:hypothetical protein